MTASDAPLSSPHPPSPQPQPPVPLRPLRPLIWLTIVVILLAATLRSPFVAVAPIAGQIGDGLAVGEGIVGLLSSIPILCFAVCAPLAVALVRRGGVDLAVTVTFVGALAGIALRSAGGLWPVLAGTAVLGAFLTVGNVVVPILIAREYGRRTHVMTGIYTSAFNVGTMTVTLTTAPLAAQWGWQGALAVWGVFAVAGLAVWLPLRGLRDAVRPLPGPARPAASATAARDSATWMLAAAFCGQAFAFYAATAWLPSILRDNGMSEAAAGAVASIFQVAGVAGALLIPMITVRASLTLATALTGIGWLTVPLGFLFAPGAWAVWCAVGGAAQGAGITLVFIMITAFRDDPHTTAGRSGLVQGVGYAVAATGPLLLGWLHEVSGAWVLPLLAVLAATVLFLVPGVTVARELDKRAG